MSRRKLAVGGSRSSGDRSSWTSLTGTFGVGGSLFTGDDIDEEIEHVGFGEGGGDIGSLEGSPFVIFGVDPGAHGEFGDEDVAALCEENRGFGRDHFDFWIGFHDFLYARERELVDFIVVIVGFEVIDDVLPVCCQDVAGGALEALVDLGAGFSGGCSIMLVVVCSRWPKCRHTALRLGRILGRRAIYC